MKIIAIFLFVSLLTGCDGIFKDQNKSPVDVHDAEPEKGLHHGRLFKDDNFTLELAIFETGVPPEYRAWATKNNSPLAPETVELNVTLKRLGGKVDDINFTPLGDVLRGDTVIYEPHSFTVMISATHDGQIHTWQYDSFEGRTKIAAEIAEALEIKTLIAKPVVMQKTVSVYGQIVANSERMRQVSARFDGLIKSVSPALGQRVRKGQELATVESNESLQLFTITAPISGVLTQRNANPGEQTDGRQLFTIINTASVWAELSVFPTDLSLIKVGSSVAISDSTTGQTAQGKVTFINVTSEINQSVKVRVVLDNKKGQLRPGRHVSAKITVGEHAAALAVKRTGLQPFRDFTVVYAQIGDEYEVRMLELGLQAGEWAEVLRGLDPGTRYVSENSYVIKADIEKSGASHDH